MGPRGKVYSLQQPSQKSAFAIRMLDCLRYTRMRRPRTEDLILALSWNSLPPRFNVPHGLTESVQKRRATQMIGHLWRCTFRYSAYTVLVPSDLDEIELKCQMTHAFSARHLALAVCSMRNQGRGLSRSLLDKY